MLLIICLKLLFFINHIFMPIFRKVEYLKRVANRGEVAKFKNADQTFIDSLEKYADQGIFLQWKEKVRTRQKKISDVCYEVTFFEFFLNHKQKSLS